MRQRVLAVVPGCSQGSRTFLGSITAPGSAEVRRYYELREQTRPRKVIQKLRFLVGTSKVHLAIGPWDCCQRRWLVHLTALRMRSPNHRAAP